MKKLFLYSAILIFFDQITKYLMQDKSFFSGIFSLNYVTNKGAAFGIFQGGKWIFILTAIIVLFLIFKYYKIYKNKIGLILVFAGATGNLIDRIFLGYVRDFISIKYFSVFNFADIFNVIGIGLLIYFSLKEKA